MRLLVNYLTYGEPLAERGGMSSMPDYHTSSTPVHETAYLWVAAVSLALRDLLQH
jgi:hypothetical protein